MKPAIAITLATLTALAAAAQEELQIKTQNVAGPVHMIEGRGGNIGISAGEDGMLMIDTQFENIAPQIQEAMKAIDESPLRFVLNTHFHGDHTGGNIVFGQQAPVIAHENVRTRMITSRTNMFEAATRNSLPVVTFDDDLKLHFNGEEIRVVHYPTGHTDTDSIIFFTESNVVHMGDHFFNGAFPFVDVAGGGDVEQYIKNVRAVLTELSDDVKIIPGHGPLATKADLQSWIDQLEESVDILRKGIEADKSAAELTEAGLPEKYAPWGTGFVSTNRWIAIVHNSLTQ